METEDVPPTTLKPGPETVAWEIMIAVVPLFVRVTGCILFEPVATFPKLNVEALAASTPGVVPFEFVFPGVPAFVNPAQPEINKVVIRSVAKMANSARELRCFASLGAARWLGASFRGSPCVNGFIQRTV